MHMSKAQWILCVAAVIWITCAIGGLYMVWADGNPPDVPVKPQAEWPGALRLARADDRPTPVPVAHPQSTPRT